MLRLALVYIVMIASLIIVLQYLGFAQGLAVPPRSGDAQHRGP